MADKLRFPQIPSTVWWGMRDLLKRKPNVVFDDSFLSIELGVQPAAAKQYITELHSVGILDEENKATPLALKWRLDDTYQDAIEGILAKIYPQNLRDLAPPDEGDRAKAISWFLQAGLGRGSAGNKAATYFLLGTPNPNEAPARSTQGKASEDTAQKQTSKTAGRVVPKVAAKHSGKPNGRDKGKSGADGIPLNVNVQIHISADAGSEQIEAIFSAMRRYLHDQQAS